MASAGLLGVPLDWSAWGMRHASAHHRRGGTLFTGY